MGDFRRDRLHLARETVGIVAGFVSGCDGRFPDVGTGGAKEGTAWEHDWETLDATVASK
jgi:hypothetical protein